MLDCCFSVLGQQELQAGGTSEVTNQVQLLVKPVYCDLMVAHHCPLGWVNGVHGLPAEGQSHYSVLEVPSGSYIYGTLPGKYLRGTQLTFEFYATVMELSLFSSKSSSKLSVHGIPEYGNVSPLLIAKAPNGPRSYRNRTVVEAGLARDSEGSLRHPASPTAAGKGHYWENEGSRTAYCRAAEEGTDCGSLHGRLPGIGGVDGGTDHAGPRTGTGFGGTTFRPGIGGIEYRSRFEDRPGKSTAYCDAATDQVNHVNITVTSYEPVSEAEEAICGLHHVQTPNISHPNSDHEQTSTSEPEPACRTVCMPGCVSKGHESVHVDVEGGRGNVHEFEGGMEGKEKSPQSGTDSFSGLESGVKHVTVVPLRNNKQVQVTYIARGKILENIERSEVPLKQIQVSYA